MFDLISLHVFTLVKDEKKMWSLKVKMGSDATLNPILSNQSDSFHDFASKLSAKYFPIIRSPAATGSGGHDV